MADENIRVELSADCEQFWTWHTNIGTKTDQGEIGDGTHRKHKEWTKTQLNNQNVKKNKINTKVTTQHRS